MKSRIKVLVASASLLVGCATVNQVSFQLAGMPCEAIEVRPSMTSNVTLATCLEGGKSLGLVAGVGMPALQVLLESGQIAASVGQTVAQGIIAAKVAKAVGKQVDSISTQITNSVDGIGNTIAGIETTVSADVSIPDIIIPPITIPPIVIPPANITISPTVVVGAGG